MDSASQDAFSEIATIAKLALASLETPAAYISPESMAHALTAIWSKALDIENHITCMAEEVDCSYKDEAMGRRMDAQRKAREAVHGGSAS